MSSRAEQKAAAREARLEAERSEAAQATRRRRLTVLGGVLAAAAVIVVAAILLGSSGSKSAPTADRVATLNGVPQRGTTLGSASAPVTVEEFADLQCPFCARFARDDLPGVVSDYVKPGKVQMRLQLLTFIGPDSVRAGAVAAAAGLQNREWQFVEAFYGMQKTENTNYVTPAFLREVAAKVPGLDVDRAIRESTGAAATRQLTAAQAAAKRARVESTPTFVVRAKGVKTSVVAADGLRAAIDRAVAARS